MEDKRNYEEKKSNYEDRGERTSSYRSRDNNDDGDNNNDFERDRRMFSKRRNCWFCAKKTEPDWKDPQSYSWLVSEFGKISARRVTGLCAYHQRESTKSIKRGRHMGLISYLSNQTAN